MNFGNEDVQNIVVVGLGYVGLPLSVALSKHFVVHGFDVQEERISELKNGIDRTQEVRSCDLKSSHLKFSSDPSNLSIADMIIVTVPTPIDKNANPDLSKLRTASATVGKFMKAGVIVVYESTVFPGVTEDICVPILEKNSGLICNQDFFVGYSPERINPGDKVRKLEDIVKIVSGSTPDTLNKISKIYGKIINAGLHRAETIKIAEAAKVIENTQRDVNIALINELAMLFDKLEIDTRAVLDAAGTKWNFLKFSPGLVGGHCIGVDPYYLTYKAREVNFQPNLILAGRSTNDNMAEYAALKLVKHIFRNSNVENNKNVLILGFTFKENCPDIRNTKIEDFANVLCDFGLSVSIYDPIANFNTTGLDTKFISEPEENKYGAVILAVPHDFFVNMGHEQLRRYGDKEHVFYDLKSAFGSEFSDIRL